MRIFLTGATGYIGSNLARHLSKAGHHVIGLARSESSAKHLDRAGIAVHRGDLAEPEGIAGALADADAVIHTAVGASQGRVTETDVAAFDAMADAFAGTNRPLLVTSGLGVYSGLPADRPADERTPLGAAAPVQRARIELEERVVRASERGVGTVVIRPALVYGNGNVSGMVRVQLEHARRSGTAGFIGEGGGLIPFVHVDDLADAYLRALERAPAGSIYNVVAATHSTREVAEAVSYAVGGDGQAVSLSLEEAQEAWGPIAAALVGFPPTAALRAAVELAWTPKAASFPYEMTHGTLRRAEVS